MLKRTVITIGNFDGVHAGHRRILATARRLADQGDATVVVVTFEPHPMALLSPQGQPLRIMTPRQKQQTLRAAGADDIVVMNATAQLLALSPEAFLCQLHETHQPLAFVEGEHFRFGQGRRGDVALMAQLGRAMHFEVVAVDRVAVVLHDLLIAPVSSSLVRWLLTQGRVADVARCLGQSFRLEAKVVEGDRRGRTIGFPTANLDSAALHGMALPRDGVYAGRVTLNATDERTGDRHTFAAAISVGPKPTFKGSRHTVEAHLLDYAGPVDGLYGRAIAVRFDRWVRDQQPFPNLDTLKAQLARDVAKTRRWHEQGLLDEPPSRTDVQAMAARTAATAPAPGTALSEASSQS